MHPHTLEAPTRIPLLYELSLNHANSLNLMNTIPTPPSSSFTPPPPPHTHTWTQQQFIHSSITVYERKQRSDNCLKKSGTLFQDSLSLQQRNSILVKIKVQKTHSTVKKGICSENQQVVLFCPTEKASHNSGKPTLFFRICHVITVIVTSTYFQPKNKTGWTNKKACFANNQQK